MEGILATILIIGGIFLFNWFVRGLGNAASGVPFNGLNKLEARIKSADLPPKDGGPAIEVKAIEVRGPLPNQVPMELMFSLSIIDRSDRSQQQAVFSRWPEMSEGITNAFLQQQHIGFVPPNQGFRDWVRVGGFPKLALVPPRGGKQTLTIALRLYDARRVPTIVLGTPDMNGTATHPVSPALWSTYLDFDFEFEGKGYVEAVEHGDESRKLAIGLAVAVAMADGSLDDREGETIQAWMRRYLAGIRGPEHDRLKGEFNAALESFFADAEAGQVSLSAIAEKIKALDDRASQYEAIELCYNVMAADGHIDPEELSTIKSIADALGLDPAEVQRIHDSKITLSAATLSVGATDESLLGIDPDWDLAKKRRHLTQEFQKWNNRLNTLPAGPERDKAQSMLDRIGNLRDRYKT
ncbi:MAG: hypothetical protein GC208_00835 [Alphaproteobacteria bacterium]|nr:hypothetical protein [Alphaproteobacteria bacterium]